MSSSVGQGTGGKPDDSLLPSIPQGLYRHYKGKHYFVLGVARHSETAEQLVVYRQEYGDFSLWVRPLPMFTEQVLVAGREMPRFEFVGNQPS